jgi:hypothetical protein
MRHFVNVNTEVVCQAFHYVNGANYSFSRVKFLQVVV